MNAMFLNREKASSYVKSLNHVVFCFGGVSSRNLLGSLMRESFRKFCICDKPSYMKLELKNLGEMMILIEFLLGSF